MPHINSRPAVSEEGEKRVTYEKREEEAYRQWDEEGDLRRHPYVTHTGISQRL